MGRNLEESMNQKYQRCLLHYTSPVALFDVFDVSRNEVDRGSNNHYKKLSVKMVVKIYTVGKFVVK